MRQNVIIIREQGLVAMMTLLVPVTGRHVALPYKL